MQVARPVIARSPRDAACTRLSAEISYERGTPGRETLWIDVASPDVLSLAADPWLVWLAPLATTLGEDLHVEAPADPLLLDNVREVLRVWRSWYPTLHAVSMRGDDTPAAVPEGRDARRVASYFTGGVDSFFTVLRHTAGDGTPSTIAIDDLVYIRGFDLPLGNEVAWQRVTSSLQLAAGALDKRFVTATTNLRETRFQEADWSRLAHGAALAGVAHALGRGYREVLIGSSAGYRDLRFWGSHPLTDPMLTSSRTRVVHDGPAFMRVEKTEYVARSPIARQHLRVCYRSETGDNCGGCNSCYRTMLALEAVGALAATPTFDRRLLDMRQAGRVYCPNDFDIRQFGYVRALAEREGRPDIVRAVDRSLRRSARLARGIRALRRTRDLPLLWRWSGPLEQRLLRGWIT